MAIIQSKSLNQMEIYIARFSYSLLILGVFSQMCMHGQKYELNKIQIKLTHAISVMNRGS